MKLLDDAKKFTGNVVCVGVTNNDLLNVLAKNKKASVYTIDFTKRHGFLSRKKTKKVDGKKVNIKKLKKTFKEKSIDNLVFDFNEMYDYFKYFISDSITIGCGKVYIYGESRFIDPKTLIKRYKRYCTEAFLEVDGDSFLIVIDVENAKTNWFKDKFYLVVDTFHNIGDMISVALIS